MDTRILDKGTPRITTLPNLSHPKPRVLHQPLEFRKRRKIAKISQKYERAMVHEPHFSI